MTTTRRARKRPAESLCHPPSPPWPSERGNDLRAPAARVEPARPSSFPAAARSRSRAYPPRITTSLADCDLDLLEKRLRPRIDAGSPVAGPARSDPEILTLITCHDATIDIGKSRRKRCRALIASNRVIAHAGEKQRDSSSMHIASAIARKIEIHQESAKGGTCTRCTALFWRGENLQKPMCRQTFATEGSQRTPVRFILPSLPALSARLLARASRRPLSKLHRSSVNASAAPAEQRVPSLQGCGGMEHSRWKGRWQAMEGPLAEAFEWALEAMEDRWKGRRKAIGALSRCASGASTRGPFPRLRSSRQ